MTNKIPSPLFKKNCPECAEQFFTRTHNKKFCSKKCGNDNFQERMGRKVALKLPTATVGTISELEISNDLMRKGYSVFRALSASCFCDVIAIKDEKMWRVEIRTGYMNPTLGTASFPNTMHGVIDCFAVFFPLEKKCRYFDTQRKEIYLYTDENPPI